MKRLIIAAMLVAGPAMAQQTMTPEQTLDALVHQATEREIAATLRVTELQRQLAAVTKERDDLRAASTPPATPARDGTVNLTPPNVTPK